MLYCNSFWPHEIPYTTHLVLVIMLISFSTMTLNGILMHSLFKTRQTNTNTFRFLIAMSTSDLLHGAIEMPAVAVNILIRDNYESCLFDQATQYGFYLFGYFSYFMLMCIAFDRLYQIRRIRISPALLSKRQLVSVICACFVITIVGSYACVTFISFPFQMTLVGVNVSLIASVFIAYSMLLRKVRIHNLNIKKCLANSNFNGKVSARIDSDASSTIWSLLMVLIITYAPFNITTPMLSYYKWNKREIPGPGLSLATMWSYIFVFAYCTVNVLICFKGNMKLKRYVKRRIRELIPEREQSETIPGYATRSYAMN